MVLATKSRRPTTSIKHKKRYGEHHRHTKNYLQPYWPYIPIILIIGLGLFVNHSLSSKYSDASRSEISATTLLSSTNSARVNGGEPSLTINSRLSTAAATEAQAIVRQDTLTGSPSTVAISLIGDGHYANLAQSLAYGFNSPSSLLSAWLNDSHDRSTILNSNYVEVGYGLATSNNFRGTGPSEVIVAIYGQPVGIGSPILTDYSGPTQNISRAELLTNYYGSWVIIALAVFVFGSLAIFVVRHSLAWRKVFVYGEKFSVEHPWIDVLIVALVTTSLVLAHPIAAII